MIIIMDPVSPVYCIVQIFPSRFDRITCLFLLWNPSLLISISLVLASLLPFTSFYPFIPFSDRIFLTMEEGRNPNKESIVDQTEQEEGIIWQDIWSFLLHILSCLWPLRCFLLLSYFILHSSFIYKFLLFSLPFSFISLPLDFPSILTNRKRVVTRKLDRREERK